MDARNLAIVFGPTLVRPQDDSVALMVKDMSDQCRVVEAIITNVGIQLSEFHLRIIGFLSINRLKRSLV